MERIMAVLSFVSNVVENNFDRSSNSSYRTDSSLSRVIVKLIFYRRTKYRMTFSRFFVFLAELKVVLAFFCQLHNRARMVEKASKGKEERKVNKRQRS